MERERKGERGKDEDKIRGKGQLGRRHVCGDISSMTHASVVNEVKKEGIDCSRTHLLFAAPLRVLISDGPATQERCLSAAACLHRSMHPQ